MNVTVERDVSNRRVDRMATATVLDNRLDGIAEL
jgi:hypothetical protein